MSRLKIKKKNLAHKQYQTLDTVVCDLFASPSTPYFASSPHRPWLDHSIPVLKLSVTYQAELVPCAHGLQSRL